MAEYPFKAQRCHILVNISQQVQIFFNGTFAWVKDVCTFHIYIASHNHLFRVWNIQHGGPLTFISVHRWCLVSDGKVFFFPFIHLLLVNDLWLLLSCKEAVVNLCNTQNTFIYRRLLKMNWGVSQPWELSCAVVWWYGSVMFPVRTSSGVDECVLWAILCILSIIASIGSMCLSHTAEKYM